MFNSLYLLIMLSGLPYVTHASINSACHASEGSGTCQVKSDCTSGFTVVGACPNDPDNVRCCIKKSCKSDTGTCLDKLVVGCSGGQFQAGFCPGPINVQCCIKDIGGACDNNKGGTGTCQDKSKTSCSGGHYEAGFCPGPTNVQCCITTQQHCPKYWVIGVRGSEEPDGRGSNADIAEMGETLEKYITYTAGKLPADTEYLGLPYPASLSSLDSFTASERSGWEGLQAIIKTRVASCPNIKIGVAGYSQGAAVVNDALHWLATDKPSALNNIGAVLLLSDPKSDSTQSYHTRITITGLPAPKSSNHGILGGQALPSQVRAKTTSLCFENDIVCDASSSNAALIVQGTLAPIHLNYINCCTEFLFTSILGLGMANRLLA